MIFTCKCTGQNGLKGQKWLPDLQCRGLRLFADAVMPVELVGVKGLVACLKHGIFELVIGKVDACVTMQQKLNAIG